MPLSVVKKKNRKYLYFKVSGAKRLYLGRSDNPKEEKVAKAIDHLDERIRKYQVERRTLERLLEGDREYDIAYRLVGFDVDGVIFDKPPNRISSSKVAVSTWDVLFEKVGMYDTHEKYRQKFEADGWKVEEWTEAACKAIQPVLDRRTFDEVIDGRPLMEGVREVFAALRHANVITVAITGSFLALAQRASKHIGGGGFDHIYAHAELNFGSNGSLEGWHLEPTDYEDKAKCMREIADKHKIPLEECAYVGDDANDVAVFNEVGLPIAFNSRKPEVNRAAKVVIESRDLASILPHLSVKM